MKKYCENSNLSLITCKNYHLSFYGRVARFTPTLRTLAHDPRSRFSKTFFCSIRLINTFHLRYKSLLCELYFGKYMGKTVPVGRKQHLFDHISTSTRPKSPKFNPKQAIVITFQGKKAFCNLDLICSSYAVHRRTDGRTNFFLLIRHLKPSTNELPLPPGSYATCYKRHIKPNSPQYFVRG